MTRQVRGEISPSRAESAAAWREAVLTPLFFLSAALLGGFRAAPTGEVNLMPPPLISLVLAMMLLGLCVRTGSVAPYRLMHADRGALENIGGCVVLVAWFAASAQAFATVTPDAGLLHLIANVFFFVLLANTFAADPVPARVLRSLFVVFGAAFILKHVVLATLYDPSGGWAKRVLTTLLEGATLGTLEFRAQAASTGYVAFLTLILYFLGLIMLPRGVSTESALARRA